MKKKFLFALLGCVMAVTAADQSVAGVDCVWRTFAYYDSLGQACGYKFQRCSSYSESTGCVTGYYEIIYNQNCYCGPGGAW